jgi:prepilin-type N-terminal cleavage/methylation domain-containing protein
MFGSSGPPFAPGFRYSFNNDTASARHPERRFPDVRRPAVGTGRAGEELVKSRRQSEQGFTLLEVMMAMLIGMVGLMGTVAVQQVTLRAAFDSNEAMVAMRLAVQGMEQFSIATVSEGPPVVDELAARAAITGALNAWSTPEYVDSNGTCPGSTTSWSARCRWKREWQVSNSGVGLPYNISVKVTYNSDSSHPKMVRVDSERRKIL